MVPRTKKLVFNFGVPIKFFLSLEFIKLTILAVPARSPSKNSTSHVGCLAIRKLEVASQVLEIVLKISCYAPSVLLLAAIDEHHVSVRVRMISIGNTSIQGGTHGWGWGEGVVEGEGRDWRVGRDYWVPGRDL